MEQLIKNLDRAQPLPLKEQVAYEKGQGRQPHPGPASRRGNDVVCL